MPGPDPLLLQMLQARIDAALTAHGQGLLVVGLCGAQGSGKSTLAAALVAAFGANGVAAAALSLDDLYLTQVERRALAHQVHPLLATRGVPGTHDIALGLQTLVALDAGASVLLPRFDKGSDNPAAQADWPLAPPHCQVLLLEGWCVGATAQPTSALADPVNALEQLEDPEAIWRTFANAALDGAYQTLFARIDLLVLLAAPRWDIVAQWREEQEAALRRSGAPQAMSPAQITRFIQHYERLSRWILLEMPARADLAIPLDPQRRPVSPG